MVYPTTVGTSVTQVQSENMNIIHGVVTPNMLVKSKEGLKSSWNGHLFLMLCVMNTLAAALV